MLPLSPQLKGIFCLIVSGAILAFTDGLAKHLVGGLPVGEVIFLRACFVFVPVAVMIWWRGGLSALRIGNWKFQSTRALCVAITTFLFLAGTRNLPLADATAILFASPIMVTAMAPIFLGEQVGWRRWTAVLVGFIGVVLMIRPGSNPLLWSAMLILAATFFLSIRDIITRGMSGRETTTAIMVVSTAFILVCGLASWPAGQFTSFAGAWRLPTVEQVAIAALTGMLQGTGQYFMVTAFLLAEAVVVVPFRYFSLIFAVFYGYLLFGDVPEASMLAGAAIVIGSGLYIFEREARAGRRKAQFQEGQKSQ
jgi:drug/metabolite transporter (DMT)-like permease